jgi:hypothetical protein
MSCRLGAQGNVQECLLGARGSDRFRGPATISFVEREGRREYRIRCRRTAGEEQRMSLLVVVDCRIWRRWCTGVFHPFRSCFSSLEGPFKSKGLHTNLKFRATKNSSRRPSSANGHNTTLNWIDTDVHYPNLTNCATTKWLTSAPLDFCMDAILYLHNEDIIRIVVRSFVSRLKVSCD